MLAPLSLKLLNAGYLSPSEERERGPVGAGGRGERRMPADRWAGGAGWGEREARREEEGGEAWGSLTSRCLKLEESSASAERLESRALAWLEEGG